MGTTEQMWSTTEFVNPLQDWAKKQKVEVYAVQLPGRANRAGEEYAKTIQEIAQQVADAISWTFEDGTPYFVAGHGFGSWVLYEFVKIVKTAHGPPSKAFVTSFPPPDAMIHLKNERSERDQEDALPWSKPSKFIKDEDEFAKEIERWDVSKEMLVGQEALYRADMKLFDSYVFHEEETKEVGIRTLGQATEAADCWKLADRMMDCPIQAFFATRDKSVSKKMMMRWKAYTNDLGEFTATGIDGGHLFAVDQPDYKVSRMTWMKNMAKGMEKVLSEPWEPPQHGPYPNSKVPGVFDEDREKPEPPKWNPTQAKQIMRSCMGADATQRIDRIRKVNPERATWAEGLIIEELRINGRRSLDDTAVVIILNAERERLAAK